MYVGPISRHSISRAFILKLPAARSTKMRLSPRVPVERLGDADGNAALAGQIAHQFGKIALEVNAERQKIRQHQNFFRAGSHKLADGIG